MKKEGKHKYIACSIKIVEFEVEKNFAGGGTFSVGNISPISEGQRRVSFDMWVHQEFNPMGNRNANAFGKTDWSDNEGAVW